jgi:hypothetical protein
MMSVSDKEYSAAMYKGNRLAATKCVFEKQQLPPHLQAIIRLSEDSLARLLRFSTEVRFFHFATVF